MGWASTYFAQVKAFPTQQAARLASLFTSASPLGDSSPALSPTNWAIGR